jgi:hypothetical protein
VTVLLQIADKAAIKEMAGLLTPLIRGIGQLRKVFLTPPGLILVETVLR